MTGAGVLSLEQLVDVVGTRGFTSESEQQDQLEDALKYFDKLEAGYINSSDLKEALTSIGEPITPEDCNELIKLAGVAPDGKLNYYGKTFSNCH